jgi:excisionase family DNA binding protein
MNIEHCGSGMLPSLTETQGQVSGDVAGATKQLPRGPTVVQGRLWTLEEVAEYLAVPFDVVEELVRSSALRVLSLGRERRVAPEDLSALLENAKK